MTSFLFTTVIVGTIFCLGAFLISIAPAWVDAIIYSIIPVLLFEEAANDFYNDKRTTGFVSLTIGLFTMIPVVSAWWEVFFK